MPRMNGTIYKITAPSGRSYVGQTWDLNRRLAEYRSGKTRTQRALHNAIAKHGWHNMRFSILACGIRTQDALDKSEVAFIAIIGALAPHGYNLMTGGDGGMPCAETRARLSAAHKGNQHRLGIPHTAEARAKISAGNKGVPKPKSAATRAKISATLTGRKASVESRAKQSAARRGKPKSEAHKAAIAAGMRRHHAVQKLHP